MSHDPTVKSGPKERRFLDALRDLFVGAKLDGKSGYINLMRIKATYFQKAVEPALFEDISSALNPFPEFREELFDKLHAFFSRYFSRSGSICFAYTPQHMSVYERVYTDEQDVVLFWKTHMLHYVKTDRLFNDLSVELDGHSFFFDCSGMELKKSNEKRELVYTFEKIEKKKDIQTARLTVAYSQSGRKTKSDDILKSLHKAGMKVTEATLDKAMRIFGRQSEVDFFINKDAGGFLREQFDLWMYQYVFKDETHWTEGRIKQLQALKDIAYKLITFIAQFEDELLRVWTKPKFVRDSHYVITLDRIAGREGGDAVLAAFLKHSGIKAQIAEWKALGIVDASFKPAAILQSPPKTPPLHSKTPSSFEIRHSSLNPSFQSLPLDTRHFDKDLEISLLGLFDDLDNQLDGRLIKSENWQALNTLREKYKNRVQLFYIDPPYNTGEDEFAYIDAYQRSSWLSMIVDRLSASRHLMAERGVLLSSIGREEFANMKQAANLTYGEENCLAELIWEKGRKNDAKYFSVGHDYILCYAKSKAALDKRKTVWREEKPGAREILVEYRRLKEIFGKNIKAIQEGIREFYSKLPKDHPSLKYKRYSRVDPNGIWRDKDIYWPGGKGPRYEVSHPKTKKHCDVPERGWAFSKEEKFWLYFDNGFIEFREGKDAQKPPMLKKYLNFVSTEFDPDADQYRAEDTNDDDEEVSVQVMTSVWQAFQQPAVMRLRKLMGSDVFKNPKDPQVIARLIKYITDPGALVGDFFLGSGTTGEAVISLIRENGGRRFLFVEAADYIETVILPRFKKLAWSDKWDGGKSIEPNGASLFFKYSTLEQYEDSISRACYSEEEDLFRNTKTDTYSQYVFFRDLKLVEGLEIDKKTKRVEVHLDRLYPDIDLAETLSCVTGKWIKRISADEVEFADGSKESLTDPDWRLIKPFIFWGPVV
jgi:adenine-specific DNA-methyltransferase